MVHRSPVTLAGISLILLPGGMASKNLLVTGSWYREQVALVFKGSPIKLAKRKLRLPQMGASPTGAKIKAQKVS